MLFYPTDRRKYFKKNLEKNLIYIRFICVIFGIVEISNEESADLDDVTHLCVSMTSAIFVAWRRIAKICLLVFVKPEMPFIGTKIAVRNSHMCEEINSGSTHCITANHPYSAWGCPVHRVATVTQVGQLNSHEPTVALLADDFFGYRWLHKCFRRWGSVKVIDFCTNWKTIYDFLLVPNCDLRHNFLDRATSKWTPTVVWRFRARAPSSFFVKQKVEALNHFPCKPHDSSFSYFVVIHSHHKLPLTDRQTTH